MSESGGVTSRVWIGVALVVAVLGPALVAPERPPVGDTAVIDQRALNVFRDWELVGAYSRLGWSHPGPMYFLVLAPLFALSGFSHVTVIATVAVLNVAALVTLLYLLRTLGSPSLLAAAIAVFGLYLARTWGLLASTWNPHVPVLPLALLLACTAAIIAGHTRKLPLVVVLGSFVAQTHVGLAPVGAAAVAAAFSVVVIRLGRSWRNQTTRRSVLLNLTASAALGCLLWSLPVADAVLPGGSANLQHIATSFGEGDEVPTRQLDRAFAAFFVAPFGGRLAEEPGRTFELRPDRALVNWAQVQGALLLVSSALWWVRRQRFESVLGLTTFAAAFLAWQSVRRMPESPQEHTVFWISIVGAMAWALILGQAADLVVRAVRRAPAIRWPASIVTACGVIAGACAAAQAVAQYRDDGRESATVLALTDIVEADSVSRGVTDPVIDVDQDNWGTVAGVVLQLSRRGLRPRVEQAWAVMFGRAARPPAIEQVRYTFASPEEHDDNFTRRADAAFQGSASGIYVYAIAPRPQVPTALRLVEAGPGLGALAGRLVDGAERAEPAEAGAIQFFGPDAFVVVELPVGTAGFRLWGQPESAWRLACRRESGQLDPIGRVRISDGIGTEAGHAFLKGLAGCAEVRISPVDERKPAWLTEVQGLAALAAGG
jgi:hypothetical protein